MRVPSLCVGILLLVVLPTLGHAAAAEPVVEQEASARVVGTRGGAPLYRKEVLGPVHKVDRIYRSMTGPFSNHTLTLGQAGADPERLWVVGYRSTILEPDGIVEMSREFMCHSNMSITQLSPFLRAFPTRLVPTGGRLFSLAQGQTEIELPEGFGVPVVSNQIVNLGAQVLNHNITDRELSLRQRLSVDFVRDRDLQQPMKPLVTRAVFGMKLIEGPDGYFGVVPKQIDEEKQGPGCMVGDDAGGLGGHIVHDSEGREFTGFWVLPPGRETNHTPVTKLLALPYDTTAHYIAVHLHPYAESVELRDLTADKTVYKSQARQVEQGIGLAAVDSFSSAEGIPLYRDHEYSVISVYDNTSGEVQDSMATMFLYLLAQDLMSNEQERASEAASSAAHSH